MKGDDDALTILRALALVEDQLVMKRLAISRRSGEDSVYHHLAIRETPRREDLTSVAGARVGLWISAALVERRADGHEVEWTCEVRNPLDGSGWSTAREVVLNESPIGEPVQLGSVALPSVAFGDSEALAFALPNLVAELLQVPAPEPRTR